MSIKYLKIGRFVFLGYCLLALFSWSGFAQKKSKAQRELWPFDQRQIVLLKKEGFEFPDSKTVAQVMDVYVKLGRVRWMTLKGQPGQIIPFEVPSDFEWQSSQSIRNLGLRFEADGLVVLAQKGVQVELQWYSTADGTPLFFESLSLPQASSEQQENERKSRIQGWLNDIWSKIPGEGYVVKRDMETVTLEGIEQLGYKVGDVLETKRLGKVERHPILKTLIKIDSSLTGRTELISIGSPFSIAKIIYESPVDPIQEGDRYLKVESVKTSLAGKTDLEKAKALATGDVPKKDLGGGRSFLPIFGVENPEVEKKETDNPQESSPQKVDSSSMRVEPLEPEFNILDFSVGAQYKKFTHTENTRATSSSEKIMSAWAPGFKVGGKVFFTKDILILADFDYSFFSYKALDTVYGVGSISSGAYQFGFGAFYRVPIVEEKGFHYRGEILAGLGFRTMKFNMNAITNDVAPSAKKYSGYEIKVRIQIPVLPAIAVDVGASKIFFANLTEVPLTGGLDYSNSLFTLSAMGKYKWTRFSEISGGLEIANASTTYTGTGTRTIGSNSTAIGTLGYLLGYTQRF